MRELRPGDWTVIAAALRHYGEHVAVQDSHVLELAGQAEQRRKISQDGTRYPCPVCLIAVRKRQDGTLFRHGNGEGQDTGARRICPGSGGPPLSV